MVEREDHPHEAEPSEAKSRLPEVFVSFSGYKPPFDPEPLVRRMIDSVPRKYLVGLKSVVITNSNGLSRKRRRSRVKHRARRVSMTEARGAYHPAYRGHPPWIEIFVDNCLKGWEKGWWLKVPFIREGRLAGVLFHEIGHHIHYTVRPEYREKEDVADVWKVRLENGYYKQRYRWPRVVAKPIRFVFGGLVDRMRVWSTSNMFKMGQISQAEYMEEMKSIKKTSDSR
jgi:hypothetical protein